MSSNINSEIESVWRQCCVEVDGGDTVLDLSRPPLSEFRQEISRENLGVASEELQPWLAIFDVGLEWLGYASMVLTDFAFHKEKGVAKKPELMVPSALVSSASTFGWSLRELCMQGFDTPAKALLRSYTEILLLCIAALHDKSLCVKYAAAQSDVDVKNFWHTIASPKNLHKRITKIEEELFGLNHGEIDEFVQWRQTEYEIISQSAHLSYGLAVYTWMPVRTDGEMRTPGMFGTVSAGSNRTLSFVARTT